MKDPRFQLGEYPKRNNFFFGRLLTAEDFQAEQKYFLEKHRLHNRLLVGFGVVTGLEVSTDNSAKDKNVIRVKPGMAIDCLGREIILSEHLEIRVPANADLKYFCIRYAEKETDPIPFGDADGLRNSKIEESCEITFQDANPTRGHRRRKSRWLTCAQDHAIPLARLKHTSSGWRVDGRYHRPAIG
jgi:hypothetical protein